MFTSIRLKNFKAYKDSKPVPLRPLTLILGANNSGKSSLLHGILLLAQTLDDSTSRQPLVTSGSFIDLGGYFDIVWGGQTGEASSFEISLSITRDSAEKSLVSLEEEEEPLPTDLSAAFVLDEDKNAIVVSSVSAEGSGKVFSAARRSGKGNTSPHIDADVRDELTLDFRHFMPVYRPGGPLGEHPRRREVMDAYFSAEQAWLSWSSALQKVAHVAPLREAVPRFGILGKSASSELGPGGENLLRVLRAEDEQLPTGARLATEVSHWIADNFKMLKELRLEDVDAAGTVLALLGDERDGFPNINVANMGEGLSQLLPIIARVLTTPADGSLLVEQPELHLHPKAQADLADLFLAGARGNRRQYIVETHSEHLLLRLRRRIAEGDVDPSLVAVLYVERDGSESRVRTLELDSTGQFDDWPAEFFDERYQEALRIAELAQEGQLKG